MNERIHILRQAIVVVTQALTNSDIAVTQEGIEAGVHKDPKTGKPVRINLPYLPDNSPDSLIDAVQGFLDQEVAKYLFTDFSLKLKGSEEVKTLTSLLEEARVERCMAEKYRGSNINMKNASQFFIDELIDDKYQKLVKEKASDEEITQHLMLPMLRALSGPIGAFASIEPSEPSAKDLSRRKDQMRLLPGLIIDSVKADRYTDTSEPFLRASLVEHMRDCKQCNGCDLAGQVHPDIRLGKKMRFMVVADCPTWEEEKKGKLLEGETAQYVKAAMKDNELAVADGYYTTLVKAKKGTVLNFV